MKLLVIMAVVMLLVVMKMTMMVGVMWRTCAGEGADADDDDGKP